jgi:hypothetical protein
MAKMKDMNVRLPINKYDGLNDSIKEAKGFSSSSGFHNAREKAAEFDHIESMKKKKRAVKNLI